MRGRHLLAVLVAVAVALVAPGLASAATGTMTGQVFGPDDAPLAGAQVIAFSDTIPAATATTDAGGAYSLEVAPGNYAVRLKPAAVAPLDQLGAVPAPLWYPGAYARVDAAQVTVNARTTTPLADVQLPLEGVITGSLHFPDGSPARASALAYDAQGRLVGSGRGLAYGDARYVIRGLPPGPLRVLFTATSGTEAGYRGSANDFVSDEYYDNRFSLAKANPVTVTVGSVTSAIDATLARAGLIEGRVRDEKGGSMAGVKVYAVRSDGRRAGPFLTDVAGGYQASGLQPGDWKLLFVSPSGAYASEYYGDAGSLTTATSIPVSYRSITVIDAQLAPAGRIRGTVRGPDGSPLAGVRVRAYGAAGNVVATYTTVADGVYTLRYLRTAGYRIGFTAPAGSGLADEFYDNAATLGEASPVTATSGSLTAGIDAVLEPAGPAPT